MIDRERVCRLLLLLAALAGAPSVAAQTYPVRPIRLVVAQSAGGNADFVARAYSHRLAERFGQEAIHVRALPVDMLDEGDR